MSKPSANRPYAEVIGDPIAHSKSPPIHNFWLEKLGIDADYRACHVRPQDLEDYFRQRRGDPDWRGCNVTIPHKQAVLPFLDRRDEAAQRVGAVNTIWPASDGLLSGTNTDVDGVRDAIGAERSEGGRAVVIGAGGAARAAFALLAERDTYETVVLARSPEKAKSALSDCGLNAEILPFAADSGALDGASVLINATQLGMAGQDGMPSFLIEELAQMAKGALVFDMVYAPLETALLKAAGNIGLTTSDGLVMLVGQAAKAFHSFFGAAPPRDCDAELRRILTS